VDLGFKGNFVSSFASCLSQTPSSIGIQAVTKVTAMRLRYQPVLELLERSKNAERFTEELQRACISVKQNVLTV
jgi:CRP-like cAMP-binding protein